MKKILILAGAFFGLLFVLWGVLAGVGIFGAQTNGLLSIAASLYIVKRINRWQSEKKQVAGPK